MNIIRPRIPKSALCAAGVVVVLLAGCVAPQQAPPPAPPAIRPLPPPPPPAQIDWHDIPATPGAWLWRSEGRSSVARFGEPRLFSLICNAPAGTVSLARNQVPGLATTMTIVTTSSSRVLATRPAGDAAIATLPARDPLLDAMAYSRGRFAVQVPGSPTLYLPSWPEVSRVIEDCRGRPTAPPQ